MKYTESEITAALRKVDPTFKEPTKEQSAIISAPLSPAIVIAGAGSGKTETMASRVLFLVANGVVKPEAILGLTFTRKAAGELSARVRLRLRQLAASNMIDQSVTHSEPTILTYHSYASRIVSDYGLRHGIDGDFTPLGEAALFQLASEVVAHYEEMDSEVEITAKKVVEKVIILSRLISEHGADYQDVRRISEELIEGISALPGRLTAAHRDLIAQARLRLAILPIVERFDQRRREINSFSFDDQMAQASILASRYESIGESERAIFHAVLLDEYQDTSQSQLRLLSSLLGAGSGGQHPVMAVGDPFQSIYGWRGARVDTMDTFFEYFPTGESDARRYSLSVSWRNDRRILTSANSVIDAIENFSKPSLSVKRLTSRESAGEGELFAGAFLTLDEEATAIAEFFADRLDEENSAAVLVRSRTQIEPIEAALRARHLPVDVVGIGGLLFIPEIVEVISLLKAIAFTDRGVALARILTSERYAIGVKDLAALAQYSRAIVKERSGGVRNSLVREIASGQSQTLENEGQFSGNIVEALDLIDDAPRHLFSERGLARLRRASSDLQRVRSRSGSLVDITLEAIRTLGLEVEVMVRDGIKDGTRHLHRFIDEASSFQSQGGNLIGFLEWIDHAIARENGLKESEVKESKGRIQIITVHGAKGLEWDHVAIPGLRNKSFPVTGRHVDNWLGDAADMPFGLRGDSDQLPHFDIGSIADCKELTARESEFADMCRERRYLEELRLGYVAVTRPRRSLLVSFSHFKDGINAEGPSELFAVVAEHATKINDFDGNIPTGPNPSLSTPKQGRWPLDSLAERRTDFTHAIELFDRSHELSDEEIARIDGDIFAIIIEERKRKAGSLIFLPDRISVSMLGDLRSDQLSLAQWIRRPMPSHSNQYARRGTEFHSWLEHHLGTPQLLSDDEIEWEVQLEDLELKELKEAWLASTWADQRPQEIELPFEIVINGTLLRGRIDAVYETESGLEVVDWKTGRSKSGDELATAATQLAAYRLALAKIMKRPLNEISAAFHYVKENETIRPSDLLDENAIIGLLPRSDDGH